MLDKTAKLLDIITVDLYNKKVIVRGEDSSVITFKCSTINELIELVEQCKKMLESDKVIVR
mgnify:FL=1|jgi:hypothetical protein|tara:strand:- start:105 stop:287 length:183 start_codon:yes stop_codon:yes gene_type:complete